MPKPTPKHLQAHLKAPTVKLTLLGVEPATGAAELADLTPLERLTREGWGIESNSESGDGLWATFNFINAAMALRTLFATNKPAPGEPPLALQILVETAAGATLARKGSKTLREGDAADALGLEISLAAYLPEEINPYPCGCTLPLSSDDLELVDELLDADPDLRFAFVVWDEDVAWPLFAEHPTAEHIDELEAQRDRLDELGLLKLEDVHLEMKIVEGHARDLSDDDSGDLGAELAAELTRDLRGLRGRR